jgi:hypothetical protein
MTTKPSPCRGGPRASSVFDHGGRRPGRFEPRWLALAGLLLGLVAPASAAARGRRANSTRLVGLVTAVEPAEVSILGGDGQEITVTTGEDFTQKVAVGSQVTAWYSITDGARVLDWMEYPRENFFVPAERIRAQIRKVITLPSSEVPDADGLFDAIARYLESSFGWYVAPRVLAEEIRNRALKLGSSQRHADLPRSTLDAIDPSTGEFDMSAYTQSQSRPQPVSGSKPQKAPERSSSALSPGSTLEAVDPATGEFDMTRYVQASARTGVPARLPTGGQPRTPAAESLVPRLASETRVDAVLEADVVEVQAKVNRLVAQWDGVEEPIAGKTSETIAKLALIPPRGAVPASTVVFRLWDARGNLLWSNRSGFAALAVKQGMGSKLRERGLPEVLGNAEGVDRWLSAVFSSFRSAGHSCARTARR